MSKKGFLPAEALPYMIDTVHALGANAEEAFRIGLGIMLNALASMPEAQQNQIVQELVENLPSAVKQWKVRP